MQPRHEGEFIIFFNIKMLSAYTHLVSHIYLIPTAILSVTHEPIMLPRLVQFHEKSNLRWIVLNVHRRTFAMCGRNDSELP